MVKEPTVISLFSGCGGSSLGYKWAGYQELLAIDFDQNSVDTFRLNFPEIPCWQRDIREVTGQEILDFCRIKKGELDLLDASPPCQGFSTAGKRKVTDPRNDLFREFVRLINELEPKVFIMENVSGMAKGSMKGIFNDILKELRGCGYQVKCKLMNAKWYGVPQDRKRLLFIGTGDGSPSFPIPSNHVITFRQATIGLNDYEDRKLPEVLKKVALRQPRKWSTDSRIYGRIKGNQAGCFSLKWAKWDDVLGTIPKSEISLTGIVHPDRGRYLNLDELKRCSSFPDDYKFTDRKNGAMRIGNAVMPKFMQAIATHVRETLLSDEAGIRATRETA